jgi:putative tryptophan/tyrosine transport system substrate-binding protein
MRRRFRQRNCRIGCDFASCCGRTAAGGSRGKRLALLHDIIPNISTVGLLTDPSDPEGSSQRADAQGVAGRLNLKLVIVNASTEREIDAAFATFAQQQVGAVIIGSNPFFTARQIISLAARHRMPGIYPVREYVASGGLMSYGNNLTEAYRHAGLYVGRILGAPSQLTYLSHG